MYNKVLILFKRKTRSTKVNGNSHLAEKFRFSHLLKQLNSLLSAFKTIWMPRFHANINGITSKIAQVY